jgi:hypothetical protein
VTAGPFGRRGRREPQHVFPRLLRTCAQCPARLGRTGFPTAFRSRHVVRPGSGSFDSFGFHPLR